MMCDKVLTMTRTFNEKRGKNIIGDNVENYNIVKLFLFSIDRECVDSCQYLTSNVYFQLAQ